MAADAALKGFEAASRGPDGSIPARVAMALSRRAIVEAGLGILDAYGLGDLSMRRVAEVLGVQAGALYYHFVLGHVVEEQTRAQLHALGVLADYDPADSAARFSWGVGLIVRGAQQSAPISW